MKRFILLILSLFFSLAGFSQLTEGFEVPVNGALGPDALPSTNWSLTSGNWATFGNNVGPNATRWTNSPPLPTSFTARTGTVAAFMNTKNNGAGNTSEDYLATPLVTIPNNGILKFYARLTQVGPQGTLLKLKIAPKTDVTNPNPNANQTDITAYTELKSWTELTLIPSININSYYEVTYSFPSIYWNQQYYLAFDRVYSQPASQTATGGDRILIDDVRLEEQCFLPTTITSTATAITTTAGTVTWTAAPALPTGASWEYVYQLDTAPAPSGNGTNTTTTSVSPSGLLPDTKYNVYIRAVCVSGSKSDWSLLLPSSTQTYTFKTMKLGETCADPIVVGTLPYLTSDTTANYGNFISPTGNTPGTTCGTNSTFLAGNDVVYAYTANFTGSLGVVLTPGQTNSGVFAYANCSSIGVACLGGKAGANSVPRSFNFPVTSGSTYYIVVSSTGPVITYTLTLQVYTCEPPVNIPASPLTVANITDTSAVLSWTNGTGTPAATSWEYYVQLAGSGIPTVANGTSTNSLTANPAGVLLPLTDYEFYVRSVCATGGYSQWTGPKTFRTSGTGSTCGNPIIVTGLPYSTTDNTLPYGNFVSGGGSAGSAGGNCGSGTVTGFDTVYSYTAPFTGAVTVTLTPTGNSAGVYAYSSCSNVGVTCAAGNVNSSTSSNPITYDVQVTSGQTYYFVVSTASPGTTLAYTFNIVKVNCAPPTGLTSANFGSHSADLSWANPSNSTSWEVYLVVTGSAAPTDTTSGNLTASTNTNFPTGQILNSNTTYDYYVRANCGDGTFSVWKGPNTFTTTPDFCAGDLFYDTGGPNGQYANSENKTTTICSSTPGGVVQVVFSAFSTEATKDALYVYDGATTTSPLIASSNNAGTVPGSLAGGYWGTTIPGPFFSTNSQGCLTFVFRSNASTPADGWVASVSCYGPQTCPRPSNIVGSNITYNSAQVDWTENGTATSWEYVVQAPFGSIPSPTATGTPTNNPAQLTGLQSDTPFEFYVRAVCSTTDKSIWFGPYSFTTKIDYCTVGHFYDSGRDTGSYSNTENTVTTICPTITNGLVYANFNSFDTETGADALYIFDGPNILSPMLASANGAGTVPGGLAGGYWGTANPGTFISSHPTGCLTFQFRSGTTTTAVGWDATIACLPQQTCSRPTAIATTAVTATNAIITWTQPTNADNSLANQWEYVLAPAGTAAPSPSLPVNTLFLAGNIPLGLTSLLPGTNYVIWVRAICSGNTTSLWTNALYFTTLVANDNCINATPVIPSSNLLCDPTRTVNGSLQNATPSGEPIGTCTGNPDDDVWYHFYATDTTHYISITPTGGSTSQIRFAVYSGTCGNLTNKLCSTTALTKIKVNQLTIGQDYFIRVYSEASTPQTSTFTLCITTLFSCDNSLCVNNPPAPITGYDQQDQIFCLLNPKNPTFYNFTIPSSQVGALNMTISQTSDVDYAAWGPFTSKDAGCLAIKNGQVPGVIPGVAATTTTGCSFSASATENLTIPNPLPGEVYILLVTNYSNQNIPVTIVANPPADCAPTLTSAYSAITYCKSSANPTPVVTLTSNSPSAYTITSFTGQFSCTSSNSANLSLNPTTGEINLNASQVGTYTIRYTVNSAVFNPTTVNIPIVDLYQTMVVTIVEPSTATIGYSTTTFCKSEGNDIVPNAVVGAQGGAYTYINAPGTTTIQGLSINPLTGVITPSLSKGGQYIISYSFSATAGCPSFPSNTVLITVLEAPVINTPASATICGSYTLPVLNAGNYFSAPNGAGPQLNAGDVITTTQTIYVYAAPIGSSTCSSGDSFTVTIPIVPQASVTVTQPNCTTPTGSIDITAPLNNGSGGGLPSKLFISEVTDAATGSLSYVELYNATGVPVNLADYKLKFYNFGNNPAPGTVPNLSCNLTLTGTIANNSTNLIKVSNDPNIAGVTADQVFTGCGGVNNNDYIVLTTSTDIPVDLWGLTTGAVYTPNNQAGFTYRRKPNATVPSATWIQSDWDSFDPEVYTGLGQQTITLNNDYLYSIDNGSYTSTTSYSGLAVGTTHTVHVKDIQSGCISILQVPIDSFNPNVNGTKFTLPASVCKNAANPSVTPVTNTNPDFVSGGTYTATPAGLVIDAGTGVINVANSTATAAGVSYTVTYTLPTGTTNCSTPFQQTILIKEPTTPVSTIAYPTSPVCKLSATTSSPAAFTAGGTFSCISSNSSLLTLDTTTGVISNISTTSAGIYKIQYKIAEDLANCAAESISTFDFKIEDPGTLATVGFSYTTPVCIYATAANLSPIKVPLFTNGGTYSSTPSGLNYNPTTGEINVSASQPGIYTVTYSVADNPTNCIAANSAQFIITVNAQTPAVLTFTYPDPVYQTPGVLPIAPQFVNNYTTGGTFTYYTVPANQGNLIIGTNTGVVDVAGSVIGTYHIKYNVNADNSGNGCIGGGDYEFELHILPANAPDTAFSYQDICKLVGGTISPIPTNSTFVTGGVYSVTSANAANLSIDPVTGDINVSQSLAGQYTIHYHVDAQGTVLAGDFDFTFNIYSITNRDSVFHYDQTSVCKTSAVNPGILLTRYASTFVTGGIFTYTAVPTNAVLSIDSAGNVNIAASDAGNYTITYTLAEDQGSNCYSRSTHTETLEIKALTQPNTTFSYTSPVCQITNSPSLTPITSGLTSGGSFSAPLGLSIGSTDGVINVQGSQGSVTGQSYQVVYTLPEIGGLTCTAAATSNATVVIKSLKTPVTAFSYPLSICKATPSVDITPVPNPNFTGGGQFSSNGFFVINPSTGVFPTSNAAGGPFAINYSVIENPVTCTAAGSSTFNVTINAPTTPNTSFMYISTPVCPDLATPSLPRPNTTPLTPGGTYTATGGLTIDSATGSIVASSNTPGSYDVTYSLTADYINACRDAGSTTIPFVIKTPISYTVTGGCDGITYKLNLNVNNSSFDPATSAISWTFGGSGAGSGDSITAPTAGIYSVSVVYNGCTKNDSFNASNISCTTQKGISPNNDGKNDTFDLRGQNVQNLSIFNRYGLKVYSKSNYTDEWGGQTDGGSELPDGTYFFMIEQYGGGSKSGWIYISRQN
ncbi:MAG: hypothetical protein CFE24_05540 [Flavobacterium sp. BFFFF2]|nr:MAG: hypothetical protein CFE24_05540 [Flavobacterium sp. BFFFF2]